MAEQPDQPDERLVFPISAEDAQRLRDLAASERRSLAKQIRVMVEASLGDTLGVDPTPIRPGV
jgi:hypothetical protein